MVELNKSGLVNLKIVPLIDVQFVEDRVIGQMIAHCKVIMKLIGMNKNMDAFAAKRKIILLEIALMITKESFVHKVQETDFNIKDGRMKIASI